MKADTLANTKKPAILRDLQATHLFQTLSSKDANELYSASRELKLEKDTMLHMQGDPATWFYFVVSGWVKTFRQMRSGEEAVIEIAGHGEFVGELAPFEGTVHSCNAAVVQQSVLVRFPLSLLDRIIHDNPAPARAMLKDMAAKRLSQIRDIEGLKLRRADQRIGCFLLRLCEGAAEGQREVTLPYNKAHIAAQLGIRGETYSRAFDRLAKVTNITTAGDVVYIPDIAKLSGYVCSGCSNEYPCKDLLQ